MPRKKITTPVRKRQPLVDADDVITLPQKLKVGGLEYTIELDPKLLEHGIVDFVAKTISLAMNDQDRIEQTLLHEILEIINCEYELALDHMKISILENVLYQVLKDNKIKFF